jgi:hypothetical protein
MREENANKNIELDRVLTNEFAKTWADHLLKPEEDTRSNRYCVYRVLGLSTERASNLAEISRNTAYELNSKMRNDPKSMERVSKISNRMPDLYRMACRFNLGPLAEAEMKAVDKYRDDPELLIRRPALAKHIKQGAGILVGDDVQPPVQQQINIKQMQILNTQALGRRRKELEDIKEKAEEDWQ